MFETVLVANRGEIAVRVIRTLRALGIRSVAVHSDADTQARHVRDADLAVRLGSAPAQESYLSIEKVIAAALRSGAQAIHPGYGFLSENASFALACADAGLVFIGPTAEAVRIMGDKISAKRAVAAAGVAVVPGRFEPGMTDAELVAAATEVGFPVLVKPAAGGGGKGMRLVTARHDLEAALISARREARSSFGDDTLFVERFVSRPRHIEVQVLADAHGGVIQLGERECSLQRRHQKIVEEAPSVLLDSPTRHRIGLAAVEIARAVSYLGAGTVEFIVSADRPEQFFFLEMNTRLQVEHPVTELVTGLDLVAEQIRIATGEPLSLTQDQVRTHGHAMEARIYAEDPAHDFLPTGGTVLRLREPLGEPGIRVDSGISEGSEIGPWYDPMLSKVIAWGPDRSAALVRLRYALTRTTILGVTTNVSFLAGLLSDPDVQAGRLDTQLVDRLVSKPAIEDGGPGAPQRVFAAYGLARLLTLETAALSPPRSGESAASGRSEGSAGLWGQPSGWRLGDPAPLTFRVAARPAGPPVTVRVWGPAETATVSVEPDPELTQRSGPTPEAWTATTPTRVSMMAKWGSSPGELLVSVAGVSGVVGSGGKGAVAGVGGAERGDGAGGLGGVGGVGCAGGVTRRWLHVVDGDSLWLSTQGETWRLTQVPLKVVRSERDDTAAAAADLRSPMPGVVLAVNVRAGEQVRQGQPLVVVEAMKMEYAVTAARAGQVQSVLVVVGAQVSLGELLLTTS